MHDIAGEATEAKRELAAEVEKCPDGDKGCAEQKQEATEITEIHGRSLGASTRRVKEARAGTWPKKRTGRSLCHLGDAAEEVVLLGDGFGADGEGVEEIEAKREFERFVLAVAERALTENLHPDDSLPGGFHFF